MKVVGDVGYASESFTYRYQIPEEDDFRDVTETRRRVTRVSVTFGHGWARGGARAGASPLSLKSPGGRYDPAPTDTEKGHLVALEHGGTDRDENLVPMWGYFNRAGTWRQLEQDLSNLCHTTRDGLDVRIDCQYADLEEPRIPTAFQVRAIYRIGSGPKQSRTWLLTHRRMIYQVRDVVAPLDEVDPGLHARTLVPAVVPYPRLQRWIARYEPEMLRTGWTLEQVLPRTRSGQRYHLEDDRPYAILDYLAHRGLLGFDLRYKVDKTLEFTDDQRALILQVNLLRHGYRLESDADDDPHTVLTIRGAHSGAEVDHVIPKSKSGTNAFSNAQLVSRQYNSTKRARLEEEIMEAVRATRRQGPNRRAKRKLEDIGPHETNTRARKKRRIE